MQLLRHVTARKIFSVFTAVIFLNTSFFLAEVRMLDLRDKQLIKNICNLISNAGLEEERDAHSSVADTALKEIPLLGENLLFRHSSLFLIASKSQEHSIDLYRHADHSEKFSPPPEADTSYRPV
jgi:hypothetical protein